MQYSGNEGPQLDGIIDQMRGEDGDYTQDTWHEFKFMERHDFDVWTMQPYLECLFDRLEIDARGRRERVFEWDETSVSI